VGFDRPENAYMFRPEFRDYITKNFSEAGCISAGAEALAATVRQLAANDLDSVDRIQRAAYSPDFLEDTAVFADKLARYPAGCWGL